MRPRVPDLWQEQQAESVRLDAVIAANLERLGFGGRESA